MIMIDSNGVNRTVQYTLHACNFCHLPIGWLQSRPLLLRLLQRQRPKDWFTLGRKSQSQYALCKVLSRCKPVGRAGQRIRLRLFLRHGPRHGRRTSECARHAGQKIGIRLYVLHRFASAPFLILHTFLHFSTPNSFIWLFFLKEISTCTIPNVVFPEKGIVHESEIVITFTIVSRQRKILR